MIRYFFGIIFLLTFSIQSVFACTTFFINHGGHMLFGRNYDWVTGSGTLHSNLRGLAKTSFQMQEGKTISWVSRYGSISFNQYGKEFPTGGMNEKGLVVELMWLDETEYPSPDERAAISVLQWIQYQLDNSATVDDVIATDKLLRIATVGTTPLHYLIADKKGGAATIEFLNGRMTIHKGNDLPISVLTNNSYKESLAHYQRTSGQNPVSTHSLDRFARACSMLKQFDGKKLTTSAVDYSFSILDNVSQGDFTKWSIVYDIANLKIYFRTNSHRDLKYVNFSSVNLDCNEAPVSFELNQQAAGDVSAKFVSFSKTLNLQTIRQSFAESSSRINVPARYIQKITDYQQEIRCR